MVNNAYAGHFLYVTGDEIFCKNKLITIFHFIIKLSHNDERGTIRLKFVSIFQIRIFETFQIAPTLIFNPLTPTFDALFEFYGSKLELFWLQIFSSGGSFSFNIPKYLLSPISLTRPLVYDLPASIFILLGWSHNIQNSNFTILNVVVKVVSV